jgi:hypothetical protein
VKLAKRAGEPIRPFRHRGLLQCAFYLIPLLRRKSGDFQQVRPGLVRHQIKQQHHLAKTSQAHFLKDVLLFSVPEIAQGPGF